MPATWSALQMSLKCKSEPSDVHDPSVGNRENPSNSRGKKSCPCSSGCSRSLSNLRDVIHGSKRHVVERVKPPNPTGTPRSLVSSDMLNHLTHKAIASNSICELETTSFEHKGGNDNGNSAFLGTTGPATLSQKIFCGETCSKVKSSIEPQSHCFICHECGDKFNSLEAIEAHHLSRHAVAELLEGDSSREIVELICQTRSLMSEDKICGQIERVLKVHNMQTTLVRFEEYRESMKIKASELYNEHPRCQVDGNELLRFYGTTVACCLGLNRSPGVCASSECEVCQILRHGFTVKELNGVLGVLTSSTSKRAMELTGLENPCVRKCLIVCRVIAGRVHKSVKDFQGIGDQSSFDSVAGEIGFDSKMGELYLPTPTALLPCFVVIFKPFKENLGRNLA